MTAFAIVWIILVIPETAKVPLEETAALFGDGNNVVVFIKQAGAETEIVTMEKSGKVDQIEQAAQAVKP